MDKPDHLFNRTDALEFRRKLRKAPTEPEKRLWRLIRNQQLGVKFRRQPGIGPYIVDFYCAERALVIELDGDSHFTSEGKLHDFARDDFLYKQGLEILRFTNQQVIQEMDGVLTLIVQRIRR